MEVWRVSIVNRYNVNKICHRHLYICIEEWRRQVICSAQKCASWYECDLLTPWLFAIFLNSHRQISRYLEVVEYRWRTYQSPGDDILLVKFYGDMRMWTSDLISLHDDVIKWKHFLRYWPFVRRIHLPPVNSPHKCQWRVSIDVYFDLRLNKRLSEQSWGW